jgi:aldose 1-epimerase
MLKVTQIPAFATLILALGGLTTPPQPSTAAGVSEAIWGTMPDGREVPLWTLTNPQGTRVKIAAYGALLVSIETADHKGALENVTLSYDSLEEALAGGVFGSVIGRFANRIGDGGFTLDGQRHDLLSFNEKTRVHIHGGTRGFHRQLWSGTAGTDAGGAFVTLTLTSPDGEEGYPGRVEVAVTYRLSDDNVLRLDYRGKTDKPTHLNLTNHAYFNLAGSGDILAHRLTMTCSEVLDVDGNKVPTGKILSVEGGPFDFRAGKSVGDDIGEVPDGGYDHCFSIAGNGELTPFATLVDPASGRTMAIATTKPGVQIFTANHFKDNPHPRWGGICFETQFYPDTPNRPEFPSSVLRPGEEYRHLTEFRFGTVAPR